MPCFVGPVFFFFFHFREPFRNLYISPRPYHKNKNRKLIVVPQCTAVKSKTTNPYRAVKENEE